MGKLELSVSSRGLLHALWMENVRSLGLFSTQVLNTNDVAFCNVLSVKIRRKKERTDLWEDESVEVRVQHSVGLHVARPHSDDDCVVDVHGINNLIEYNQ